MGRGQSSVRPCRSRPGAVNACQPCESGRSLLSCGAEKEILCRLRRDHLVGDDGEAGQCGGTEDGGERHVGGIAAAGHHDAADARLVVARVERVPAPAEVGLEPGAEVHRLRRRRYADVAQVAGAVAGRDVHAAAQGDGEVRKVAAHAAPLVVAVERRARRRGMLVAEGEVLVDVVADGLHAAPALRRVGKQRPGRVHHLVGVAVAAAHQVHHHVVGQGLDGQLLGIRLDDVGRAGVADDEVGGDDDAPGRRDDAGDDVAEHVAIVARLDVGLVQQRVRRDEIGRPRRMHAEHQQHRRRPRTVVGDFEASADLHDVCPLVSQSAVRHGIAGRASSCGFGKRQRKRMLSKFDAMRRRHRCYNAFVCGVFRPAMAAAAQALARAADAASGSATVRTRTSTVMPVQSSAAPQ